MNQPQPNKEEIKDTPGYADWALAFSMAFIYDGVKAALLFIWVGFVVNWIISIWAVLTFFLWLMLKGKKGWLEMIGLCSAFIADITSFGGAPAWTTFLWTAFQKQKAQEIAETISPEIGAVTGKLLAKH